MASAPPPFPAFPGPAAPPAARDGNAVSPGHRALVALGLLALAGVAAAAVFAVYRVFVTTRAGQRFDDAAFQGAEIGRHYVVDVALQVLDVVSVLFLVLAVVVVGVIAIGRRRYGLGLAAVVLVGGANLTTQVLKYGFFERPDYDIGPGQANSLPSGHTTVAASVAAALILVVPRKFRIPTTILAGGYATLTGISTLVAGWHRPSDVVAALLVVGGWTALVVAFAQLRQPARRARDGAGADTGGADPDPDAGRGASRAARVVAWLLLALFLIGMAGVIVLAQTLHFGGSAVLSRRDLLMAYGGGAVGIASVACLVFALALALSPVAGRTRVRQRDRSRGQVS